MQDDAFEWDDAKAASNRRKHRVDFIEARHVFDDPNGIDEPDDDPDENRWKRTGRGPGNVLIVVFAERFPRIRIISARRANRHEQAVYDRQALP